MSTLGQKPATQHVSLQKQTITGNGGTSYTLQQNVGSALDVAVFVNNTRQEPTSAYSASGTTLTMTGAVNSSDHFYVIFLGKAITTTGLPVDAVATANINASSITNAKIANSTIDLTSKVTGILPAANGGTGATSITTGKILQVLQAQDQTQRAVNATSYAIFSNTLSVAVTPAASTSKFLVSFCTEAYSALNAISLYLTIFRDSTDIGNSSGYGLARHYVNASDVSMGMNGVKLDSPNTASQITYTVRAKLASGSGPAYFNSQSIGTLTVIEVGA